MLTASWVPLGPGPVQLGQVENVAPNHQIAGAIHALAAHPTDADVLYVGSVNGGIWKTTNATDANPNWSPQTDFHKSLSISALEFDTTDATSSTLVASTGRVSSFGTNGPSGVVLRTTNGGATWTDVGGAGIVGENLSGIAGRGSTIVVSSRSGGLFRSTDTGANFSAITSGGISPSDDVFDLAADPSDGTGMRLYAGARDDGLYRSDDFGSSWTKISHTNSVLDGMLTDPTTVNDMIELAVHPTTGRLYVAVIQAGRPVGVFYSSDAHTGSPTWVQMDVPVLPIGAATTVTNATFASPIVITTSTAHGLTDNDLVVIDGVLGNTAANGYFRVDMLTTTTFALVGSTGNASYGGGGTVTEVTSPNPRYKDVQDPTGSQGAIHFSIRADPIDDDILYIGGDRQDLNDPIGDFSFGAAIFRGDAGIPRNPNVAPSPQWDHITHDIVAMDPTGGTASGSAPHADSREMVFDADGNLIEANDGGIYKRTSPHDNTGDWYSMAGNVAVVEFHDVAYDTLSNVAIGGTQDNGTHMQYSAGNEVWKLFFGGDGGDVVVDNTTLAGSNQSIRYSSSQNLGDFQRSIWDAAGNFVSSTFPTLLTTSPDPAFVRRFYTPIGLNNVAPTRMLFGGGNGVYESTDSGNHITRVSDIPVLFESTGHPIDFGGKLGGVDQTSVAYFADDNGNVYVRTEGSSLFTSTDPLSSNSNDMRSVRMDPDTATTAYALSTTHVFQTTNSGGVWSDITGNLSAVSAGATFYSMEYVASSIVDAVVAGTSAGIYASLLTSLGTWFKVGDGLPNALVYDLDFDPADDVLLAGTLGRGAWLMTNVGQVVNATTGTLNVFIDGVTGDLTVNDDSDTGNRVTIQSDTANSRFVINDPQNTLTTAISGFTQPDSHTVTIPFAALAAPDDKLVINGNGASDTILVDYSLGNFVDEILANGSDPASGLGDALILLGGGLFAAATVNFSAAGAGTIALTGNSTLTFSAIEQPSIDVATTDLTVNFTTAAETLTIVPASVTTGVSAVVSTAGTNIRLTHPTGLLTLNAGDVGGDTINLRGLGATGTTSFAVNGQTGTDSLFVENDINAGEGLAQISMNGGNLTLSADTITIEQSIVNSGAGQISVIADRNIFVRPDVELQTDGGNLTLSANQAEINGDFDGIELFRCTVTSVDGDILIQGRGGNQPGTNFQQGVWVIGSRIESTGSGAGAGTITIEGEGGDGAAQNYGVVVQNDTSPAIVRSVKGDISISGTGGDGTGDFNHGVIFFQGSVISTGTGADAADISIDGDGGFGNTNNTAIIIVNAESHITSVDGSITITGEGHGTGNFNSGILLAADAHIESTGIGANAGDILLQGTGAGATQSNRGIEFSGGNPKVTSIDGDLQLIGVGGNSSGNFSQGLIFFSGLVQSTGSGDIGLTATAGGASAEGIWMQGGTTVEATGSGDMNIVATRVGSANDIHVSSSGNATLGASSGTGALTVTANLLSLDDITAIRGTGALAFAPRTASTTIGIGGGTGTLNLNDTELSKIVNGFSSITFGSTTAGTGAVDVDAFTFVDSVNVVGGSIAVTDLNAGSNSISLTARTGSITDGGDVGSDVTAGALTVQTLGTSTGAIGASSDVLTFAVSSLTTNTSAANGNQFFSAVTSLTWNTSTAGTGSITLHSGEAYTGSGQTITANTVNVNDRATLGGTGTVSGLVKVNTGGEITGGTDGTVGTFSMTSLNFNGGTYQADLAGDTSDTLTVSGTIDLTATVQGVFSLNASGSPTDGHVFTLINNTHASNAIVDPPFSGTPNGSVISLGGKPAIYSYSGGVGNNDFVLTVDATAPSTVSFTRKSPAGSPTNANSLTFLATFSENVIGVGAGDFAATGTTGTISVVQVTASTYDVTVSGGDLAGLNGIVGLNFSASPTITDLAGNALPSTEPAIDETYVVDNTAPSSISFTRKLPATSPTSEDTLTFLATFSEDVTGVGAGDFAATGTTGTIGVVQVTASTYDVTISGGDLPNLNGTVGLNFSASPTITDLAGNSLPNTEPGIDETYVVDNDTTITGWAVRDGVGGAAPNNDGGNSIAVDSSGNVIVAGSLFFEGDSGTNPGDGDIVVAKYSPDGTQVWRHQIGSTGNDRAISVAVDAAGNSYVVGVFQGTVDFDPSVADAIRNSAGATFDIFVLKLNAAGQFVKVETFGQSGGAWDIGTAVAVSGSNIVVGGVFGATVDFNPDPGAAANLSSNSGSSDIFLLKLTTDLTFVWAKKIGGSASDSPASLAIDGSGRVMVTGTYEDQVVFDPNNSGNTSAQRTANGTDGFALGLDADGNYLWVHTFGGSGFDQGRGIAVDASRTYVAGTFQGNADTNEDGVGDLQSAGSFDILVARFDSDDGDLVWLRRAGSTLDDRGRHVALDAGGNLFVSGFFGSSVDFDPGAGTRTLTSQGGRDGFVWKLDADGNYQRVRQVGGSSDDEAKAIAVHSDGTVSVAGYFQGTVDFPTGTGITTLTSAAAKDLFVWHLVPIDLAIQSAVGQGGTTMIVSYTIEGTGGVPFDIGVYRSVDGSPSVDDLLLDTITIGDAADLTVGSHQKTISIGTGGGEVVLPGAGAADVLSEYQILVVADPAGDLQEMDTFAADNVASLQGAYHPAGGKVYVHGTSAVDTISAGTTNGEVVLNGTTYSFNSADVTTWQVWGHAGNDVVNGSQVAKLMWTHGGDGDDTLTGTANNDTLIGGLGNDTHVFDSDSSLGVDTLDESAGGIDLLDFSATTGQKVAVNLATSGSQVVNANLSLVLSSNSTIDNVIGGGMADTIVGNTLANTFSGGPGNDSITGASGNDTYLYDTDSSLGTDTLIESGGGIDTLDFSATSGLAVSINLGLATAQVVNANLSLILSSTTTFENVLGGQLADTLTGNSLANTFVGGPGNDVLSGSSGNDLYLFDADTQLNADSITDASGVDTIDLSSTTTAAISLNLASTAQQTVNSNLKLTLMSASAMENLLGGALNDTLTGNTLANVLIGNDGSDNLNGGAGNDTLVGGAGNDTQIGGAGNDTHQFDADTQLDKDTVDEAGGGTDTLDFSQTITTSVTVILSQSTEQIINANLRLILSSATTIDNVIGGAQNDTLTGGTGVNAITGGPGDDQMNGDKGNDTYWFDADVDLGADTINESLGGTDALEFSQTTLETVSVDLSLTTKQAVNGNLDLTLVQGNTLENLVGGALGDTLKGNSLNNLLTGGAGNDTLKGAAGNDTLTGATGDDTLEGGLGDDTYIFDTDSALGNDEVVEQTGEGTDTLNFSTTTTKSVAVDLATTDPQVVNSNMGLTLASVSTLENVMGGAKADTLKGNSLANVLTGNADSDTLEGRDGADTLIGNAGNDTLIGGGGDDSYPFDADAQLNSDVIDESAGSGGGGTDTITLALTTAQNVALSLASVANQTVNSFLSLQLTTGDAIEKLIGGSKNDTLTGNVLANTITGGPGNDTQQGGDGDDVYVFDADAALGIDTLTDTSGIDLLDFSATTAQAIAVNLGLTGNQTVNSFLTLNLALVFEHIIGGSKDDTLTGNSLNNVLLGGPGNDTISGMGGRDLLVGGTGADNLSGGADDDILISGIFSFYTESTKILNRPAIDAVMAEWSRTDAGSDYATRISRLRTGGGLNGSYLINSTTVLTDGSAIDTLLGQGELDWFWKFGSDSIGDQNTGGPETVN